MERHLSATLIGTLSQANRVGDGGQVQAWRAKTKGEKRKCAERRQAQHGEGDGGQGGGKGAAAKGKGKAKGKGPGKGQGKKGGGKKGGRNPGRRAGR